MHLQICLTSNHKIGVATVSVFSHGKILHNTTSTLNIGSDTHTHTNKNTGLEQFLMKSCLNTVKQETIGYHLLHLNVSCENDVPHVTTKEARCKR